MTGATIDHLVSMTVFLAAILLFVGLFNQTIQTAISYQRHRSIANKCSDLLDTILLSPGTPDNWGENGQTPTSFGLQEPEFSQYRLSAFSLMRLNSALGSPVFYSKTGLYYSNATVSAGVSLLVAYNETVNYTTVSNLLGINGTYGFSFAATPTVEVQVSQMQQNPLTLSVYVSGAGFPLANADVSYVIVTIGNGQQYPTYNATYGTGNTNSQGSLTVSFPGINGGDGYLFLASARINGLVGIGYIRQTTSDIYPISLIEDFGSDKVLLAHSSDIVGGSPAEITYNATFILLARDFTFRDLQLTNATGLLNSGEGQPPKELTLPMYDPGILIVTFRKSANEHGIVMMPWGVSSLAFPVAFGDNSTQKEWVATEIREVIVDNIAYQVKLALWSLEGYQVVG